MKIVRNGYNLKERNKAASPNHDASEPVASTRLQILENNPKMTRKKIDQNDPIEVANSKSIEEFVEEYLPLRYVSNKSFKNITLVLRNLPHISLEISTFIHFQNSFP